MARFGSRAFVTSCAAWLLASAAHAQPSPVAPVQAETPPAPAPAAPPPSAAAAPSGGPIIELDEPATQPPPAAAAAPAPSKQPPSGTLIERASNERHGVTLGGYGEHDLVAGRDETTHFQNHRFVVLIFGRISERITTTTELELEFAGSPLKRDGVLGPGEVLLEFSVLDIELAQWLVLRAGVILMPFGSYNLNHDAPAQELADRPIAYTSIVPTTWFESGAGLHGKLELPGDQGLGYELYVVNGLDARIEDGTGFRGARGSHFEDNNSDKGVVLRAFWQPTLGSEFGLSGYTGAYDKRDNRVNMLNLDAKLRAGDFELQAEGVYAQIDSGYVEGFSEGSLANTRAAVPTGMWGFYLQANYQLRIAALTRLLPDDFSSAHFTLALRYEGKDTDVDVDSLLGDQRRLTLGINFRPVPQVALKSDFQWNAKSDGVEGVPELWNGGFWDERAGSVLFDRYVFSIAYLF